MPAPLIAAVAVPVVTTAVTGGSAVAGGATAAAAGGGTTMAGTAATAKGGSVAAGSKIGAGISGGKLGGTLGMPGNIPLKAPGFGIKNAGLPKIGPTPTKIPSAKNNSAPQKVTSNTKNQIEQFKEKKSLEETPKEDSSSVNDKNNKTKNKKREDGKGEKKEKKEWDQDEELEEETEEESEEENSGETKKKPYNENMFRAAMLIALLKDGFEIILTLSVVGQLFIPIISFIFTLLLSILLFISGTKGTFKTVVYFITLALEMFAPGLISALPITSIAVWFVFKKEKAIKVISNKI